MPHFLRIAGPRRASDHAPCVSFRSSEVHPEDSAAIGRVDLMTSQGLKILIALDDKMMTKKLDVSRTVNGGYGSGQSSNPLGCDGLKGVV